MDFFEPIRDLNSKINAIEPSLYVDKIVIHIERAFQLFTQGVETGDEQNFTDVIYRCNQAFEGCSRQAFLVLAEKSREELKRVKAWEIEQFLIDNDILNERSLPFFKNYREKWRNESSHNFNLFFKEEESYMAIMSISSYAYVLLNQILLKLSMSDIQGLEPMSETSLARKSLIEDVEKATKLFLKEVDLEKYKTGSALKRISEVQFLGIYSAFLQKKIVGTTVTVDGIVNAKSCFRYDMMLSRGEEKVMIELKPHIPQGRKSDAIIDKLTECIEFTKGAKAVLFFFKGIGKMTELQVKNLETTKNGKKYFVKLFIGG